MKKRHTTIDLFAGVGGIRIGFENAGFKTVFANDIDEKCATTYNLNFKNPSLTVQDVVEVKELPHFDILLAGFPCQPFSIAGRQQGVRDKRGQLFFEIERILKHHKPVGFFLENVKNLCGVRFKSTFEYMLHRIDTLGYDIQYAVMNTAEYGNNPQNRERVYIVGFLKETEYIHSFVFPKKMKRTKTIEDILEQEVQQEYYYANKPLYQKIKHYPFRNGVAYQWRWNYVRENKNGLCPTLTANMGTGGHNVPLIKDDRGVRKLTPLECFRLQGFPHSYQLPNLDNGSLYKQAGNSVSVPVVTRIAKQMNMAMV